MSLNSLPNELLFDILNEACTHPFPRCRLLRRPDRERECQSPLTISHVSQRLRHLVIHSPFLWTCIHLTPESSGSGSLNLVELFLQRSQNFPISLTFVRHPKLQAKDPLWSLLMSSVQRWQDVALYGIDPQDPITIPLRDALASASLPHLRSLIFEVDGAYPRDVDLTLTAPNLTCARFTKMVLAPESWQTTCQNLSHLSIGHVTFDSWYDLVPLLATCKGSLQTLLLGPQVGFKEREDEFKVSLPQLRSLSVTRGTGVGYGEVLKNLVAPSRALLASVRRLKIIDGTLPQSVKSLPKQFLHAFPNVDQLCLESRVAAAVLSLSSPSEPYLTGSQQDPSAWPALRELVISDRDGGLPAPYAEDLLKFIQARTCEHPLIRVYSENPFVVHALRAAKQSDSSFHEFEPERWQGPFIPEELASMDSCWRMLTARA